MPRYISILVLASMLLIPFASAAAAGSSALGSARLHSIDQSGISAEIFFLDSGGPTNGLVVSGRATGLDPAATFITLVYDTGAEPAGPGACLPSNSSLTSPQMFVGVWQVAPDGTGTLFAHQTGDAYVTLGSIGAVSVRDVQGPIPEAAILVACGNVHRNGTSLAGEVD